MAGVLADSPPVWADCAGDTTTVVCSGTDTDGYDGSANINQTITVNPDASVENSGDGITVGEGGILTIEVGVNGVTADGQVLITPTLGAGGVVLFGDNGTVVNNGLIKVDTSSLADPELASGIDILGTDADITNNGTIEILFSGGPDNRGGIGISSVLGYATVNNTGDITISNASGALAEGVNVLSNTSVTNSGNITITGGPGVDGSVVDPFDPLGPPINIPAAASTRGMVVWGFEGVSTTQVSNSGQITVTGDTSTPFAVVGVQIDDAGDFDNSGTITVSNADVTSDSTGLLMSLDTATGSITNSGTITAMNAVVVTPANLTFADMTLLNSGALEGHVDLGDGNNTITNTSTGIIGAVDGLGAVTLASNLTTGTGDDTLTNYGRITGNVDLGDCTNIVTNATGAQIDGSLTMGTGDDLLTNAGTIVGDVNFGAGDDKVIIQDGAVFSGTLDGGTETTGDIIELQGSATLVGVTYTGFEIIGGNCESVDVDGYSSDTDFDLGQDCDLTNHGTFDAPNIIGGDGSNTITNSGTISANIDLGGGDDRFIMIHDDNNPSTSAYLNSSDELITIEAGAGTDTLELQGNGVLGQSLGGTGPTPTGFEALEVKGEWSIGADMEFSGGIQLIGEGSSLAVIGVTLTSTVTGDDSANTLANWGAITGAVDLGGGSDTLQLLGYGFISGSFGSTVTGGAGMDTLELVGTSDTTNVYDGSFTSFEKLVVSDWDLGSSEWALEGTQAYTSGVILNGAETHLLNRGTLTADITGDDEVNLFTNESGASYIGDIALAGGADTVTNAGNITGDINFGDGADILDNTGGTITGNVDFGAGDDYLHGDKLGTISGSVIFGTGDDTFVVTSTSLGNVAAIDAGTTAADGTDTLLMSGSVNSILLINTVTGFEQATVESAIWTLLGDQSFSGGVSLTGTGQLANWGGLTADVTGDFGVNLLSNAATGTLTGDVTLNGGNDGVWNLGTLDGTVDLGANNDWLTNSGTITGDVLFGDGVDEFDNTGGTVEGKVDFGAGDEVFDASKTGTVTGGIFLGDGNDTVNNAGNVVVDLNLGDGADRLVNTGTITGNVDFGAGSDVLDTDDLGTITGTITLGDGNDTLNNTGTYAHDMSFGDGNNLLNNSGTFTGDVDFGDGIDTLNNNGGTLVGNISFGDGVDTLDNTGGSIVGAIDFGAGDDVLDVLKLGQIEGSIDMGAGDDTLRLVLENGTFDGSSFDLLTLTGGDGLDTFELSGSGTFAGSIESDMELLGLSGLTWVVRGTQSYDGVRIIGTATLINESTMTAEVLGDESANTLINKATITGDVSLGDGVDVFDNGAGTITGNVDLGGGNESLASSALGTVSGSVSLGAGDDVFNWNGSDLEVGSLTGGEGFDTLLLIESGTFASGKIIGMEKLDIQGTDWTLTGSHEFSDGVILGSTTKLTNSGQLTANVTGGNGANTLTNSGTITGDVGLGDGSDRIDNSGGTITGNLDFGAGDDVVDPSKLGTVNGEITLGTGNDRLIVTASILNAAKAVLGDTDSDYGTDTLEVRGTGSLNFGDFSGYEVLHVNGTNGAADWTLNGLHFFLGGVSMTSTSKLEIAAVSGLVGNITGDAGANTITNNGNLNASSIDLGGGNDVLENSGLTQAFFGQPRLSMDFGDGDNRLTNSGTITGDTTFGAGADEVSNSGTIKGNLDLGSGDNSLTNSGTITGAVALGDGINVLTNSGELTGDIGAGNGADTVTNTSDITGNIALYNGTNSVDNSGTITGSVSGGAHEDSVINTGTITGSVSLGGGTNSVINRSVINGNVMLAGIDKLVNEGTIGGAVQLNSGSLTVAKDARVEGGVTATGGNTTTTNNGTITGPVTGHDSTGDVRSAMNLGLYSSLQNNGTITGTVQTRNSIENYGTIDGSIVFSDDANTLLNDGTIDVGAGKVDMAGGADTLIISEKSQWDSSDNGGISLTKTAWVDGGAGGGNTLVAATSAGASMSVDMQRFVNFEHFKMVGEGSFSLFGRVSPEDGIARIGFATFTVKSGVFILPSNTYLMSAHAVRIESGGTLKGRGRVIGAVWVDPGGRFAPGTSIGTFEIEGELVMAEGSIFELEVIGSDVDQVIIDGTATLGGTLEVISDFERSDNELGDTFQFMTATDGITGSFSEVRGNTPYFSTFTPVFTAGGIEVRLDRDSFVIPEMNAQQQALGARLDTMAAMADAGDASTQIVDFVEDMTWTLRSEAASAFNQLTNQTSVRLATPTLRARQTFMGHVMDNAFGLMDRKDHDGRWAISGNLYGEWGDVDGDGNAFGYSYKASGAMTSFDYRKADTSFGFALGGSRLDAGASDNGRTSLDTAAYVTHRAGNGMEFGASLGYSLDYYDSSRRLQTTSQNLQLEASPSGHSVMANMHIRKQFTLAGSNITTLADLQYARLHRDAFEEEGGNDLGLSVDDNSITSLKSTLGLRLSREEGENAGRFQPMVGLFWEHEFGDKGRSTAAAFQALPDDEFAIYGVDMPTDQFRVEAGLMTQLWDRVILDVTYSGTFAGNLRVSRGQATIRYVW
ncbi:hypothetical protein [Emcibacter sp.]|uniref:hypothetical protein n=1 Tax=Emcibacter sp. TaxID=1979954 RepID=UPI002AA67B37|nr:hypothetical protein [Emcibacter sp.]